MVGRKQVAVARSSAAVQLALQEQCNLVVHIVASVFDGKERKQQHKQLINLIKGSINLLNLYTTTQLLQLQQSHRN